MAALLHCIIVEIENSRWKDHIRDWNTNMKVDMYDKMKEKLEKQKEHTIMLRHSVFNALDTYREDQFYQICAECELFYCTETQGGKYNVDGDYYCESCIEKNPDLEFSDEEDDED
jgi:hypothetical protein